MARHFFSFLTVLSALLLAGVGALWVRSHYVADAVSYQRADGWWGVLTAPGHLGFGMHLANRAGRPAERYGVEHETDRPVGIEGFTTGLLALSVGPGDTFVHWRRGGFAWVRYRSADGSTSILRLVVPLWVVLPVGTPLPAAWWARHRRERGRRKMGLCPACGYDLRASPGRCPECGGGSEVREAAA